MGRQSHYEDKKRFILLAIHDVHKAAGRAPSVRELAYRAAVGVATVHSYLGKMAQEGLIVWQPKAHRTLRLTPLGFERMPK